MAFLPYFSKRFPRLKNKTKPSEMLTRLDDSIWGKGEREKVTFFLLPNNNGFLSRWKRQLSTGYDFRYAIEKGPFAR